MNYIKALRKGFIRVTNLIYSLFYVCRKNQTAQGFPYIAWSSQAGSIRRRQQNSTWSATPYMPPLLFGCTFGFIEFIIQGCPMNSQYFRSLGFITMNSLQNIVDNFSFCFLEYLLQVTHE